jgi:hypothetical protein
MHRVQLPSISRIELRDSRDSCRYSLFSNDGVRDAFRSGPCRSELRSGVEKWESTEGDDLFKVEPVKTSLIRREIIVVSSVVPS